MTAARTPARYLLLLAAAAVGHASPAAAQDPQATAAHLDLGIGGFLAVTAEQVDGEDVVGLNVLPLTVEWAFVERLGLRLRSVLNLDLVGGSGLTHRGGYVALLGYLFGTPIPLDGLYVGPALGFTRLPGRGNHDLTLTAELGYRWELSGRLVLDLCVQLGATRLSRGDDHSWTDHLGLYPGLSYWL